MPPPRRPACRRSSITSVPEEVDMWRTAFGVLLVGHGLLTILIWSPSPSAEAPMNTSRSWLLGDARTVSVVLAVVAGLLIAASGVGLLAHQGWWSIVGLGGGVLSL